MSPLRMTNPPAIPKLCSYKPGDFGVVVYKHNAMPSPCADCPFRKEKEGKPYLTAERMEGIKFAVTMGQPFICHKTVYQKGIEHPIDPETGFQEPKDYDRRYRTCRGAVDYALELAEELGIKPDIIE